MQPAEIICVVESAGGHFMVKDDVLGVRPASIAQPVLDEIRMHKWEIIGLLSERPAMPARVRLIHWKPKPVPIQVSRGERVTDVPRFVQTTLMQVDARLRLKAWLAGNWPLSELVERLAAVGCVVKLENSTAISQ